MAQTLPDSSENRILFLDNIRYLMIVFVVLLHAASSYATVTSWFWYIWDAVTATKFFDIAIMIIDVFAMPVLFFIAGYFALPDIRKKGTLLFLKDKFIRLGIPWLIGVIFIAPIISYIYHYKHLDYIPLFSYGQFWLHWMKTASEFQTGFRRLSDIINFSHSVYWFISLLLFFFVIFGLLYSLKKKLFSSAAIKEKTQSRIAMLLVMLFVGILCALIFRLNAIIPYPHPDPWAMILSVLQFQSWRLPVYIIYFALGIYAFSRNWFVKNNTFPGHPFLWLSLCIILCFAYLVSLKYLFSDMTNMKYIITYVWLISFLRVIFLIVFMNFAFRYWNRPNAINETLAANSYNIYLVHLPIVVVLQLLLLNLMSTPSLIKFSIVSLLSFSISYAISKYATKPHPRLSIAAVVVIFLLMVIFV